MVLRYCALKGDRYTTLLNCKTYVHNEMLYSMQFFSHFFQYKTIVLKGYYIVMDDLKSEILSHKLYVLVNQHVQLQVKDMPLQDRSVEVL